MALGPMIGGGLTEFYGWRWIQFINLPLAALVMLGVWRAIPAEPGRSRPEIDFKGIISLSGGLVLLLFAFGQAPQWGWGNWRTIASLAISVVALDAFFRFERRAGAAALVPADIVRIRAVWLACLLKLLMAPAYAALVLYLPQIMQKLMGFSPLETGVRMLPMLGGYAVVSFLVGPLTRRIDVRFALIGGMALLALGPFMISRFDVAAEYGGIAVGMLVMGIGLGLFQPASVTEAVKSDDKGRKSLAGGLVLMSQWIGGAIGLGLTTTIVASSERAAVDRHLADLGTALPAAERAALDRMLAGSESAQQVLAQFTPPDAARLIEIAGEAFATGVRSGLRIDAGIVAIGVLIAVVMLGSRPRSREV
jgi:predicted MFS family arabinose efflux permease